MLYPVELRAHRQPHCRAKPARSPLRLRARVGRGRGIRTPDTLLPKQVRYQTALYPAESWPAGARTRAQKAAEMVRMRPLRRQLNRSRQPGLAKRPRTRKNKGCRSTLCVLHRCSGIGAPGEIRTPDHQVRSLVLYPTELRAREPPIVHHAPDRRRRTARLPKGARLFGSRRPPSTIAFMRIGVRGRAHRLQRFYSLA